MPESRLALEWQQSPEQVWDMTVRLMKHEDAEWSASRRRTLPIRVALGALLFVGFALLGNSWELLAGMALALGAGSTLRMRQASWLMKGLLVITRQFRRQQRLRLTLDQAGILFESPDSKWPPRAVVWGQLQDFYRDPDGYALAGVGVRGGATIPRYAFRGTTEESQFLEFITRHAPHLEIHDL